MRGQSKEWLIDRLRDMEYAYSLVVEENTTLKQELMFACEFDGYTTVEKDRYDYAIDCMEENGRDEPNEEDELNGLRRLIDAAMEVKK